MYLFYSDNLNDHEDKILFAVGGLMLKLSARHLLNKGFGEFYIRRRELD